MSIPRSRSLSRSLFHVMVLLPLLALKSVPDRLAAVPHLDLAQQDSNPTCRPSPDGSGTLECQENEGRYTARQKFPIPRSAGPEPDLASLAGGPDAYGYVWDDSGTVSWVDATDGTDLGFSGSSINQAALVSLPFSFGYYEDSYSQVWVTASGYLAFTDNSPNWPWQSHIPSVDPPNDVLAPYWSAFVLDTSGPTGRVYTDIGGAAPNRYFVAEWYEADSVDPDDQYTFEVILYENGDFRFQYLDMTSVDGIACGTTGIEDRYGQDGLNYLPFCGIPSSNLAIDFSRPPASARMFITSGETGQFVVPGETYETGFTVRNTGNLGTDVYEFTLDSTWSSALYKSDGITPVTDSDSDGSVDTGSLAQGASSDFVLKIDAPSNGVAGDHSQPSVMLTSSVDDSVHQTIDVVLGIPSNFAQAVSPSADGAMYLWRIQPASTSVDKASLDGEDGYTVSVVELPQGFAMFWTRNTDLTSVTISEIRYAILDRHGQIVAPATTLADHTGAATSTYDSYLSIASDLQGNIGVLFVRELWDDSTGESNYNAFFSVVDPQGNITHGPENLTNNSDWGTGSDLNVPTLTEPRIAATGDSRFVMVWQRGMLTSGGNVDDIFYAISEAGGTSVAGAAPLTADTAGDDLAYVSPTATSVTPDRALVSWVRHQSGNDDVLYTVLASDGSQVKSVTDLSIDDSVVDWSNMDAVQLADGRVFVAWQAWGCFPGEWLPRIRFALLDTEYDRLSAPTCLTPSPESVDGDAFGSVTRDGAGHAILTWTDDNNRGRRHLFYALLDSDGTVITPTINFLNVDSPDRLFTSYAGYGNTTYHPFDIFLPLIQR